MVLIFEDLPNELLLFIFHHLSIIDLLWSFYRVNHRFSSLIRTSKYLSIDFSSQSLSKTQFIHIINQLRSLNIQSIRISTRYYVDAIPFFISYIPSNQLVHLQSLTLIDIDRNTIEKLVHNYPKLTSLAIESSLWRTLPHHCLPHFSTLTHCRLPILDLLNGCHPTITNLILDHCTTDNLLQLNTFIPNLHSLTLTLTNNTHIPQTFNFPSHLRSLKLILRSVLFTEFERLILMFDYLENLIVSFSNTEYEVHCFDQYLFGENWFLIQKYVHNLQLNIIIHRTLETFSISEILFNFNWFQRKIVCQTMDDTNGYHLYSLPFIDKIYRLNSIQNYQQHSNDFHRVHHLHLTIPNKDIQDSWNISSLNCIYQNLETVTIIASCVNENIMLFIDNLVMNSHLRILELRFTSTTNNCRDCFDKVISRLPLSIEILILNTTSTRLLSDLLDNNHHLLPNLKRLLCSVKNRDCFDMLILLLLETFHQKSLVYLNISLENPSKSSNLLSGWLLKTNYLKKARIKCSDRQCAIWI